MRARHYIPILFWAAIFTVNAAEKVTARIAIDPVEFPWHKTTTLSVIVEAPTGSEVTISPLKDHLGGLVQFGEPARSTEGLPDGRTRVTERYVLEAPKAEPGKFTPDPVTVTVQGNEPITLPVQTISVRALTEEEDAMAQRFAPPRETLNVKKRLWEYWQFWTGLSAAALIATVGYLLYRWYKRQRPTKPAIVLSPWETALNRLGALQSKNLIATGMLSPYYVELSAILRHYIEDRFDIRAPERTTPEFLVEASNSGKLTEDQQRLLAVFLRHCDRVKFAQYEPTRDDAERHFADIKRFVEETVPVLKPAEEAA